MTTRYNPGDTVWLPPADAAIALGIAERTLRLWASRGEIQRRQSGKESLYAVLPQSKRGSCPASTHGMRKAVQLRMMLAIESCLEDQLVISFSEEHAAKVESAFNLIQTMLVDGIIDRNYLQTECAFITSQRIDLEHATAQFLATV
jgi:hypothetical protein